LNRVAPRSLYALLPVVLVLLCATSCTVPLAPGYQILKESREVRFRAGPPPELRIRTAYTLQNIGLSDLAFVDVIFPDEKIYGRTALHVEWNGHEVTPEKLPVQYQQEHPDTLRLPCVPPWARREQRNLQIDYSFVAPAEQGARITLGASDFHLGSRGWIALPQPPNRVLAPYPGRPAKTFYTVRAPDNFLVLAGGTPAGRKKAGGETEYRFELRKNDLPAYIVAGSYLDSSSRGRSADIDPVSFWTLQPLQGDPAAAAQRIAAAWSALQKDFGPLDKNIPGPHIVESAELRARSAEENQSAVASFPGGALVNSDALALGFQGDELTQQINQALAHSWFGVEMYPAPDAAVGIGEGLPNYATIVVDESSGGEPARRLRIRQFLEAYESGVRMYAGTPNSEQSIITTMLYDPFPRRRIAAAKAALFFSALEDAYGEAPVRSGLAQVVALLRGKEVGFNDLRAALEQTTGKDLAEPFRVWLYSTGMPQDFHNRYATEK
jgi:hypothetical protein